MYVISENIRVRKCGKSLLLVNMKTNSIQKIDKKAFDYLKRSIDDGLSSNDLIKHTPSFVNFVKHLSDNGVLEETAVEN